MADKRQAGDARLAFSHLGVVDLGSNSVRACIYRCDETGDLREVENVKRSLRLGGRLDEVGHLPPEAVEELCEVLARFRELFTAWSVDSVTAVATAVFRQAGNGAAVLEVAQAALGHPIRLLGGLEEARYGALGMLEVMPFGEALVVDLGGASVELTAIRERRIAESISLPFGAVTLTQRFLAGVDEAVGLQRLREFLAAELANLPWLPTAGGPLVAMGGSARSVGRLHMGRRLASLVGIQQHVVPAASVHALQAEFCATGPGGRADTFDLPKERCELLPVALSVFAEILGTRREALVVCGAGLREGLLFEHLRAVRGAPDPATMAVRGAERLLLAAGGHLGHSRHVRHLALRLFDGLAASPRLAKVPGAREVLEVAALLREAGRVFGQQGFEAITFPMVLRSALPALSSVERAKAALVAAFRTPRQLKADLEPLSGLIPPSAGPGLECLGAIVLVAEALDRTRSRAIADVSLVRGREGWSLVLQAAGDAPFEFSLLDEPLARLGKILKEPVQPVLRLPEAVAR